MRPAVNDDEKNIYRRGWLNGLEQSATWHDERERAMRETGERADPDLATKCLERANWHRDCAKAIRDLNE